MCGVGVFCDVLFLLFNTTPPLRGRLYLSKPLLKFFSCDTLTPVAKHNNRGRLLVAVRIIETTDAQLTPSLLAKMAEVLVFYFDSRSHVGRDQKLELAKFLSFTGRKALAIDVPRQQQEDPNRPVRLNRLPTLALFQHGTCVRKVEGLVRFNQIGKQLF